MTRKNSSSHLQNHPCQHPKQTTNAVLALVVRRNTNVNVSHWRICVAKSNCWNIAKSGFPYRLMIGSWISKNQKTRLVKRCLKLICKSSRSMPPSNCMSSSILSKFQNCSLTIWSCRLYNNILRVLNCNNNSCSKL
eukprot:Gb_10103 [translate_table: standard]